MPRRETPTDFHRRREVGLERRLDQADKSHETGHVFALDHPRTEAMFLEMGLDAIDHGVGLLRRHGAWKEFHHPRVGVHLGERYPVLVAPGAQSQTLGFKLGDGSQFASSSSGA